MICIVPLLSPWCCSAELGKGPPLVDIVSRIEIEYKKKVRGATVWVKLIFELWTSGSHGLGHFLPPEASLFLSSLEAILAIAETEVDFPGNRLWIETIFVIYLWVAWSWMGRNHPLYRRPRSSFVDMEWSGCLHCGLSGLTFSFTTTLLLRCWLQVWIANDPPSSIAVSSSWHLYVSFPLAFWGSKGP